MGRYGNDWPEMGLPGASYWKRRKLRRRPEQKIPLKMLPITKPQAFELLKILGVPSNRFGMFAKPKIFILSNGKARIGYTVDIKAAGEWMADQASYYNAYLNKLEDYLIKTFPDDWPPTSIYLGVITCVAAKFSNEEAIRLVGRHFQIEEKHIRWPGWVRRERFRDGKYTRYPPK